MRAFLGIFCCFAVAACVGATEPWRDFHCVYPGDTVGVVEFHDTNHITTSCTFIVQKTKECADAIDSHILFHARDCVVGSVSGD